MLTQHGERCVGPDGPRHVGRGARVEARVRWARVDDEEDVVRGHDVHPPLPGRGEVLRPPVLLPRDGRTGLPPCATLQAGSPPATHLHGGGHTREHREHWGERKEEGDEQGARCKRRSRKIKGKCVTSMFGGRNPERGTLPFLITK